MPNGVGLSSKRNLALPKFDPKNFNRTIQDNSRAQSKIKDYDDHLDVKNLDRTSHTMNQTLKGGGQFMDPITVENQSPNLNSRPNIL